MADFIGFTLNGIHSSDLGIVRTSNGSRFDDSLLPSVSDRTTQITGRDGTLFLGRDYKQASLNINIAYDAMTEEQMRKIREILAIREPIPLIFDETPYKKYMVISTANSKLSYIAFDIDVPGTKELYAMGDEYGTGRVYKGEGSLNFTLYSVYGISTSKYIEDYDAGQLGDWNAAVGLLSNTQADVWNSSTYTLTVYNPGMVATKPKIILAFADTTGTKNATIQLGTSSLIISDISLATDENGIVIDCAKELIFGYKSSTATVTNTLYNQYVTSGYFFSIPTGYDPIEKTSTTYPLVFSTSTLSSGYPKVEYNYYFL